MKEKSKLNNRVNEEPQLGSEIDAIAAMTRSEVHAGLRQFGKQPARVLPPGLQQLLISASSDNRSASVKQIFTSISDYLKSLSLVQLRNGSNLLGVLTILFICATGIHALLNQNISTTVIIIESGGALNIEFKPELLKEDVEKVEFLSPLRVGGSTPERFIFPRNTKRPVLASDAYMRFSLNKLAQLYEAIGSKSIRDNTNAGTIILWDVDSYPNNAWLDKFFTPSSNNSGWRNREPSRIMITGHFHFVPGDVALKGPPFNFDISINGNYIFNNNSKGTFTSGEFTLLDRPDEVLAGIAFDFPVNKYIQPVLEMRFTQHVGGRTPHAFENSPVDALAGVKFYLKRWMGFGLVYRLHLNQQDRALFEGRDATTTVAQITNVNPAGPQPITVVPSITRSATTGGFPRGFRESDDADTFIGQLWVGRRNARTPEFLPNQPPTVTLSASSGTIVRPCSPGTISRSGQCPTTDNSTVQLSANATDPDGDTLLYTYTTTGGRVTGDGANVSWDLSGVQPGTYTSTVEVEDGIGGLASSSATVTVAECGKCEPLPAKQQISCSGAKDKVYKSLIREDQPLERLTKTLTRSGYKMPIKTEEISSRPEALGITGYFDDTSIIDQNSGRSLTRRRTVVLEKLI